jgi:hypothetical protein
MLVVSLLLAFVEPLYRLRDAIVQAATEVWFISFGFNDCHKEANHCRQCFIYADELLLSAGCSVRGI